ncbi:MAG: nucleoside hydrolase [Actinomycetota bacterium]|nr:nucleoside hydrolase [Actinomycetota bacterium]
MLRHATVILDCDPGHDDAVAILLALAQTEWRIDAITVVAGNQTLPKTTRNALTVLTVAGRTDVPVYAGCDRPLERELHTAANVHGESGLEGPTDLPEPAVMAKPEHSVDFLIRYLDEATEPVTLIPTGPLTNVSSVLLRRPDLSGKLERIVLMGGAVGEGNTTPSAEFNVYTDPEAARVVFRCGAPVTMIGLDVTHQALVPEREFEIIRSWGGPVCEMVADLLVYFARFHRRLCGFDGVPIHDACAVAVALRPELATTRRLHVDVETTGELTTGRTVVDLWGVTGNPPNADVAVDIDRDGFFALLYEGLRSYAPGGANDPGRRD